MGLRVGQRTSFSVVVWVTTVFMSLALASVVSAAPRAQLGLISSTPAGAGAGQLNTPSGVAVNRTGAGGVSAGDIYVADRANHRVAQFHADGQFVAVFGKGVNSTTGTDICTAVSTNVCKAGSAVQTAGSVWNPVGVAVDQATGNVFVFAREAVSAGGRVNIFSAQGVFQGAFGWRVNAASPEDKLQFCTMTTNCLSGMNSGGAGGFGAASSVNTRAMDLDASGHIYVPNPGNRRIDEFAPVLNGSNEVTNVSFVRGIGWSVNAAAPEEKLQICTTATGCKQGNGGAGGGQFWAGTPVALTIDASGSIYAVATADGTAECSVAQPCRIQKFNADGTFKEDFGPSSGACRTSYESGRAVDQTAIAATVDQSNQHVLVLKRSSETGLQICEFDSTGNELARYPILPMPTVGVNAAGLAAGEAEMLYAVNGNPGVFILGPAPAAGAEILPASKVGQTSATVNGVVNVPLYKGSPFPTFYEFEISPDGGFHWETVTSPPVSAGSIAGSVEVHQAITGLKPNVNYLARLAATTSGTTTSDAASFTTLAAPPTVSYAVGANTLTDSVDPYGPTTAKLAGYVNPNSSATTYKFEYGLTTAYGQQSPAELEPYVGSGGSPVPVKANLSGLQPMTTYHYRIVARSPSGTTVGGDRRFTTAEVRQQLNSCGLPDGRCFELVSPSDKGPVAAAERAGAGADLQYQVSSDGNGIAYQIANGLPDSTAPNEVLYRAGRSASGWASSQLSPPLMAQNELNEPSAQSGRTRGLSADFSCGIVVSPEPLTDDAPTKVIDAGGANLFRRDNSDGSYRVITHLPPLNAVPPGTLPMEVGEYELIGMDEQCERAVFATPYRYAGIAGSGGKRLYEWDDGTLRNVGVVPGPSGEAVAEVTAGDSSGKNHIGAVSRAGDTVFFTAASQLGGDLGRQAVFARLSGTETVDLSQSETATKATGAKFQAAARDGSRVFFTANYGLTALSSSGPSNADCSPALALSAACDLYEYDFHAPSGSRLRNLSVDTADPMGAQVAGVLAISDDGEYVYFAARGMLVPGEGPTFSQNQSANAYSVYLAHGGETEFVGVVRNTDLVGLSTGATNANVLMSGGSSWAARATPDGRHLAFGSSANFTGYASGGPAQVYLFAAESGVTICVSCRRDGAPSVSGSMGPLVDLGYAGGLEPRLSISANGSRVFFSSKDALVAGSAEGRPNLYEWQRGQVYLMTSQPPGFFEAPAFFQAYAGASGSGDSVFFTTPEALSWEDKDGRNDMYVARVGGGFSPPPPEPPSCNPLTEGSCQGGGSVSVLGVMPPASQGLFGPGNDDSKPKQEAKKGKKKSNKGKKGKGKKKSNKGKKGKGKQRGRQARGTDTNGDRRAKK